MSDPAKSSENMTSSTSANESVNELANIARQDDKDLTQIDSRNLGDFPRLTLDELRIFALGSYFLAQSLYYLDDMLTGHDRLYLEQLMFDNTHMLVRWNDVRSRHDRSRTYMAFVKYRPRRHGLDSIAGHYCTCVMGNVTMGSCVHVLALVYYLSYGMYEQPQQFNMAEAWKKILGEEHMVVFPDSESDYDD